MTMLDDKRKFVRVNYPCSITVWGGDGFAEVIMANTSNISAGGLCVYLTQILSTQTKLEIKIDNFFEGNPLKCLGSVVRCQMDMAHQNSKQKFYEVGIEFDVIDAKQRVYLEVFVQRLKELESKNIK